MSSACTPKVTPNVNQGGASAVQKGCWSNDNG
jgi:hypothetical protein